MITRISSSLLGVEDTNALIEDAYNKTLRDRSEEKAVYMSSVAIDMYTLDMARGDRSLMANAYQAAGDSVVGKLRKDGYPDGSYRVEFAVQSEPDQRVYRVTARVMVDKRTALRWLPSDAPEVKAMLEMVKVPELPPDMDGPMKVKRVKLIGG